MTLPTVTVRLALGQNAMAGTPTWTDVSTDVQTFRTKRGRQFELDRFEPGEATLTLGNAHGNYWPNNGASPYSPNILPGCQLNIQSTYNSVVYDVFSGLIENWRPYFRDRGGSKSPVVDITAVETFKILARYDLGGSTYSVGGTTYAQELSGTRVANVLDSVGWPTNRRTIAGGQTTVQAGGTIAAKTTAFDHLDQIQQAELGMLWQAPSGTVVYQSRHTRLKSPYTTSQGTVGVGTGEWLYTQPVFDYDDRQIYNDIEIVRQNGGTKTASDVTSQNSYGKRSLTRTGILMTTDGEAQDQADFLNSRFKEPDFRVSGLTIKPEADPTVLFPQILQREISDRITVSLPAGSVSEDYHLEGVEHEVLGKDWSTKWWLSPASAQEYWALGMSKLGTNTRLAY